MLDKKIIACLNPCFSGTYSRRLASIGAWYTVRVLILVLVEHTLGETRQGIITLPQRSLNPCFSGTYSRSEVEEATKSLFFGLNPCFSGTYSRSLWQTFVTLSTRLS